MRVDMGSVTGKVFLRHFCRVLLLLPCLLLGSCASMVSNVTSGLAEDLSATILNSRDVETIREGIPAYLIMIDSFLRSSPDDPDLLLAASNLNGAFSAFTEGERSQLLTTKALAYAFKAGCIERAVFCELRQQPIEAFNQAVEGLRLADVPVAFAIGTAWAGWIQAHSDDWNAIAQLSRVKRLMTRVIELNENYENGGPHLYMGGLETILPASMGGKPDKGREHFEAAIRISEGRNLMAKVVYAEQYARLVFDQALHDRLLNEVLTADPEVPGLTLVNTLAQERAKVLLADSKEYF